MTGDPFTDPVASQGWEAGRTWRFAGPGRRPLAIPAWQSLKALGGWLGAAINAAAQARPAASSAAEWLLDNGYIVKRAIVQLGEDLPAGFYMRLRPLEGEPAEGEPRILILAHGLLHAGKHHLSRETVLAYLEGYQTHHALDIAELWALPAMLRLACLERLVRGVGEEFPPVDAPFVCSRSCLAFTPPASAEQCIAHMIGNLVAISSIDWKDIFDQTSAVDRLLRKDPAKTYAACDFETRDACRRSLEDLASRAGLPEVAVAETVLAAAREAEGLPASHVGHWLCGAGLPDLEQRIGIDLSPDRRIGRAMRAHAGAVYAALLFLCGIAGLLLPASYLALERASPEEWALGLALSALPTTVLAVTLVNWLITSIVPPRRLPKLDYRGGIDRSERTLVAVPVILGSVAEAEEILARIELHRLANPEADAFVLLSDPADGPAERLPGDEAIEQALRRGIIALNRKWHGGFCLLHRARRYNRAEGCWMGWERKRGKIEQFNTFLLTGDRRAFPVSAGAVRKLVGARFVVTADADTRLAPGSVARLAGTLAHPLNRPVFDEKGRVVAGYTVLQPRIEIGPHGARTRFARLFGGDSAIDIYSRAVSDVHQDLTGTGNYVGKGIYDVAAFERSLEGRIPENLLLSHDLWEGLHGRAGLASDIVFYESFPESYAEYVRRWHRWVRGDWQLLPWLFARVPGPGGARLANRLTTFDRLRIWDNMRRSLVPPSVLALLVGGWFLLPGSPAVWSAIAVLVPGAWLFTEVVTGMARGRRRGVRITSGRRAREHLARWLMQIAFLPADSFVALHAIVLTLARLRRGQRLLQWTSAAEVNRLIALGSRRSAQFAATWPAPAAGLVALAALAFRSGPALVVALPFAAAWLAAPAIAQLTALSARRPVPALDRAGRDYLRGIARRSWFFFERFAGPQDHWLPPDNHQEAPIPATAHRTSPTNIGMMALAALSAWRLGHLGTPEFALRMQSMLDALERLERWHGHILNWIDTRSLAPLEPRYVSTVDSGNLAVSLVTLAQGCRAIAAAPLFTPARWKGFCDCLRLLSEGVEDCDLDKDLVGEIRHLQEIVAGLAREERHWVDLLEAAERQLACLRAGIVRVLVEKEQSDPERIERVHDWLERCEHHLAEIRRELLPDAISSAERVAETLEDIAHRADAFAQAMDFAPLYDTHRRLFHIGYDVSGERLDPHLYDLLASEARLASFFAIAKRDVPSEHWFRLGRPVRQRRGRTALVSWNGSMFEYLMPALFVRSERATLIGMTESEVVAAQKAHAARRRAPWGISESGFASYGGDGAWRYRAFGVPGIGLRRGLEEDLVIAPYASALALPVDPRGVVANLRRIEELGALGRFGFHEAIDFTPSRLGPGGAPAVVRSYMAHHHGMSIAAIANAVAGDAIVRWFGADHRIQAVDLLLNERIPWEIPAELERREVHAEPSDVPAIQHPQAWETGAGRGELTHLLGNGRVSLMVGTDGASDFLWEGNAVTCPTGRERDRGHFLHLRTAGGSAIAGAVPPFPADTDRSAVIHPHKLEIRSHAGALSTVLDVLVAPVDDVAIRRLRLVNHSDKPMALDFASEAELALAPLGEWNRHPAFARLFVEARRDAPSGALVFARRARDPDAPGLAMAQRLVCSPGRVRVTGFGVSRRAARQRLARPRSFPEIPPSSAKLETHPLDAASLLAARIALPPRGEAELAVVTALAASGEEALEVLERYGSLAALDWTDDDARHRARTDLARIGLPAERLREAQLAFSALVSEPDPRKPAKGNASRQALWELGLSGELPILLYEPGEDFSSQDMGFVLRAHRHWRWLGVPVDLAILYPGPPGYIDPVRERIAESLRDVGVEDYIGQPGGIVTVGREQREADVIEALEAAARVHLKGPLTSVERQIEPSRAASLPLAEFVPTASPVTDAASDTPTAPDHERRFDNGLGGFTRAGDYAIELGPGETTPAPWSNVIANAAFGTVVTEAGLGFTFGGNSGEQRITPWHNDPQRDPQGEALYLRDEASGAVWTVTPLPAGGEASCRIEHRPGETVWTRSCQGLEQSLSCSIASGDPVKIVKLAMRDTSGKPRRITATFIADWIIGANAADPSPFRTSRYRPDLAAIIGCNPAADGAQGGIAFLGCSGAVHGLSTSRCDVLGRPPDWKHPQALAAWGLGDRLENAGEDAIAALQVHLDISAGGEAETVFFLGMASSEDEAAKCLARLRGEGAAAAETGASLAAWAERLDCLQVQTPDPAFDLMVGRWLPYQVLSSRVFARAGFYQASGAYGFRDQLQDVTALFLSAPDIARAHILRAAAHQFEEGDVLHWWHPPSGKGVRTRCSDDLVWLPFVTAEYIRATGDTGILAEEVPFLRGSELAPGEGDRYAEFPTGDSASLFDHCARAFERAFRTGTHGLALMGDGDWNDGMNRIGAGGRGESVWLAFFLIAAIRSFSQVAEMAGHGDFTARWPGRADELARAVEEHGWDGEWYLRAFDDHARPWGSAANAECRIDALVQAWSVIAEADEERARRAVDSAFAQLVRPSDDIARLLDPPFAHSARDPGYIKAYPPGIRENGGQYSHAAAWLGIACAMLGDGARAKEVFDRINPACHAATREDALHYAVEPYAVAGDISGGSEHLGRGGWTWYTGAAGWAWRLATEYILGIRLVGGRIELRPCLPPEWDGFRASVRANGVIEIQVRRGDAGSLSVDGRTAPPGPIEFPGEGRRRKVELIIGPPPASLPEPAGTAADKV
ncbi:glucoamylase family protein [Erythrobacter sp.]|uniref:GH36-type glycosyl hydrolase domain-containing protein n=1 Tax=Erythrobacter sp. TaxID=1042 RepID=UPI001425C27D|nr:glucoamylase family protein [Erythrobacter sp.]QIQ85700.1 MAG: cellobiose phosphorylase [Erythrobacter sp.]